MVVDPQSRRGVALRIEVHHQDAGTMQCERSGEVDRRGRLAHPTLLVGDDHDARPVRPRQPLTGATKGLYRQLSRAPNRCVVHRWRCFT